MDRSVAEEGGRAVPGSVFVLSCNDGLRVSRLLGGRGMEAAAALGGERSAWLVFGRRSSMGSVFAYAEEGVEVKVGSGDASPLLALRRLNKPAVL